MAFYKNKNNTLLIGENKVISQTYTLLKEEHKTYTYPTDGWYWFDTIEEAKDKLNIILIKEN